NLRLLLRFCSLGLRGRWRRRCLRYFTNLYSLDPFGYFSRLRNHSHYSSNRNDPAFEDYDLEKNPADRSFNLVGDLLGLHLEEILACLHLITLVLVPLRYFP